MSSFSFDSPHPVEFVRDQITAEIEARTLGLTWPFCGKHKLFRGKARDDGFRLVRMIDYQNSYLQVAHCQLEPQQKGTRVNVQLRPSVLGLSFNVLWTIGWTWYFVACQIGTGNEATWGIWLSIGMIAFVWILMLTCTMVSEDEYKEAFKQMLFPKEACVAADTTCSPHSRAE